MKKRLVAILAAAGVALIAVASPSSAAVAPYPKILTKKYWTAVVAFMSDTPPVRWQMGNYTFTQDANGKGKVSAWTQTWQAKKTVNAPRSYPGTIAKCNSKPALGAANCPVYGSKADVTKSYSGTFTWTADANPVITITWDKASGGGTQKWKLTTVPGKKLGKMVLQNPAANWSGFGYGSTKAWSQANLTKAPITSLKITPPYWEGTIRTWAPDTKAKNKLGKVGQSAIRMPINLVVKPPAGSSANLGWVPSTQGCKPGFYVGSNPCAVATTPQNQKAGSSACLAGTSDSSTEYRKGFTKVLGQNHLFWFQPNGRQIIYENYKRCLVKDGMAPYADSKTTHRGAHILMMTAIFDDDGKLVGAIGGEASSSGGGHGSYGWVNFVEKS